ncbi:MAG TPA: DUF2231 domain-containing protein [Cryomorphaceae bacterium]|nr:DUF2231 domain-containing protein [Cryomorphaceae bacterium]
MNQLPDFWRTEVFHPLSVHLPIALLLMATFFKLVSLWNNGETWNKGGSILLFVGVIGGWISIYTGNLADGIVSRELCDPTVLKDHENASLVTVWLFTSVVLIEMIHGFLQKAWLKLLMVMTMLIGSGFLGYTGHLGATLVYQQAAGVYVPSSDCEEFE